MAKLLQVVVLSLLSLIVLQLHRRTSHAAAVATSVVIPRICGTLVPQQTAGGEIPVRVIVPALGLSSTLDSGNYERDGQMNPQALTPPPDPGVRTQTGDQWTAGTDSTISLRLEKSQQDDVYMVLTAGGIKRGDLDTFSIQERCVPHICKMILYTDSRGWLPCWYPVFVDVSVTPVIVGTPASEASDYQKWQIEEWLPPHEWSSASSLVRDHCPNSSPKFITTRLQ